MRDRRPAVTIPGHSYRTRAHPALVQRLCQAVPSAAAPHARVRGLPARSRPRRRGTAAAPGASRGRGWPRSLFRLAPAGGALVTGSAREAPWDVVQALFDLLAHEQRSRPGVTLAPIVHQGLKVSDKVVARVVRGRLVVQVPADRAAALIADGEVIPFAPMPARRLRGWLMVEPPSATALDRWRPLIDRAGTHLAAQAAPAGSARRAPAAIALTCGPGELHVQVDGDGAAGSAAGTGNRLLGM